MQERESMPEMIKREKTRKSETAQAQEVSLTHSVTHNTSKRKSVNKQESCIERQRAAKSLFMSTKSHALQVIICCFSFFFF